jgi:hypothetical protein
MAKKREKSLVFEENDGSYSWMNYKSQEDFGNALLVAGGKKKIVKADLTEKMAIELCEKRNFELGTEYIFSLGPEFCEDYFVLFEDSTGKYTLRKFVHEVAFLQARESKEYKSFFVIEAGVDYREGERRRVEHNEFML